MKEDGDFRIGDEPVSKIVEVASQIVKATIIMPGNVAPERQGGYLVIRKNNGTIILLERIGICSPLDVEKYLEFAQEKGLRLSVNEDVSSWQSRNPENGKWGGAIAVNDGMTISFSGLKEIIDEAVVLVLAMRLFWLTGNEVKAITEISENCFVGTLYDLSLLKN